MLDRNDATFFYNIIMFFHKLQYFFMSYYVVLCLIMSFCIIKMFYIHYLTIMNFYKGGRLGYSTTLSKHFFLLLSRFRDTYFLPVLVAISISYFSIDLCTDTRM